MASDNSINVWFFYLILVGIGITGGAGDIWIYFWAKSEKTFWFFAACTVWLVSLILFGFLLKSDNRTLTCLFIISTILHVILVLVCDLIFFNARFGKIEWLGVLFAFIGIFLMEFGKGSAEKDPQHQDQFTGNEMKRQ